MDRHKFDDEDSSVQTRDALAALDTGLHSHGKHLSAAVGARAARAEIESQLPKSRRNHEVERIANALPFRRSQTARRRHRLRARGVDIVHQFELSTVCTPSWPRLPSRCACSG